VSLSPPNKKILGTKNVYKLKRDPVTEELKFKVRNVVKGYLLEQGIDYTEAFAGVAANASIRGILAMSLYEDKRNNDWSVEAIDVEAAFLEGEMDHELYIELPFQYAEYCAERGIELGKNVVLRLMNSQYGCVQSTRIWSKKFVSIVTNKVCQLKQCKTDPCIFYRRDDKGKVVLIMAAYIDDEILCGKRYAIDDVKRGLREHLTITDLGPLQRHLGVYYTKGEDDEGPYYETEMKDFVMDTVVTIYEDLVGKPATVFPTPGYPSTVLSKNDGGIVNQTEFRSIIGKLSFAVKKCVPDCANAVRDLCGHMESPGEEHWKALGRLIGYLKGNYRPLKLRSCPTELRAMGAADADWGTSEVDRKSIGAFVSGIGGALLNWQSKKQTGVALSSTEAEFASASELGKDIKFYRSLIDEVTGGIPILPSHISEDNTGAIFLMKNNGIGSRTKHIDIRMRFLNDMVENGELGVDHCPGQYITPMRLPKIHRSRCTSFMRIRCTTGISCHLTSIDRTGGFQHCIAGARQ
jgi:hypothetical protein